MAEYELRLGWQPEDLVVVLWAYFDESGHSEDPRVEVVSVAGGIAPTESWTRLERRWRAILSQFGVTELHMKLLAHFRGEFAGWDDRRRRGLLGELLPLMNREISEYVGRALVLPHSWRNTSEDRRERLRDPYYGCFAFCLQSITSYAAELSTKVNVVVASHPEFSGYALHIFEAYKENEANGNRLGTLTFGSPTQIPALQVGDLVAYEIARYILEREVRGNDVLRWPLQQIRNKSHRYLGLLNARLPLDVTQ